MFKVGDHFQSAAALITCFSTVSYCPVAGKHVLDPQDLMPNTYGNASIGSHMPVWHNGQKMGYADCTNNSVERAFSLWEIMHVSVNGSGNGDSHNVSGQTMAWPKYECVAKRVSRDGSDHPSGEVLHFCSSGPMYIKDYQPVQLDLSPQAV